MIKPFLLPIGLLVIAFIVISFLVLKYNNRKLHAWSLGSVAFLILLFFTPLGANFLVKLLENPALLDSYQANCLPGSSAPTVVILAGGLVKHPSNKNDISSLSKASIDRVSEGLNFAKMLGNPKIIIAGGNGWPDKEADIMISLAKMLGFPANRLTSEDLSHTTYESAINIKKMLSADNIDRVWLVTSAIHMPRAAGSFTKVGLKVCTHPVDHKYLESGFPDALVPQISALTKSTQAMHEFTGLFWYYLTNRI
jgi:uncharacterized SAM-binding protein YcdF (DUF218 family)